MPSAAILEFDELLKPIPGDDPAGADPRAAQSIIKTARQLLANPENSTGASAGGSKVPRTLEDLQKFAIATLADTTKDFEIASRLAVILLERYSHRGLRDGLRLLRLLVDEAWDRIYPKREEPGDEELIVGRLKWLGDKEAMAPFPHAVASAPLFGGGDNRFSALDCDQLADPKADADRRSALREARDKWKAEDCQKTFEDIQEAAAELARLDALLREKLGLDDAGRPVWSPSYLADLAKAVALCQRIAGTIFREKCPGAAGETDKAVEGTIVASEGSSDSAVATAKVAGRREILEQMLTLAAQLKQIEPHSPIPHLVERAVSLGGKPFQEMILELFRSNRAPLETMLRDMGIDATDDAAKN